ncbi:hypothetical protein [Chryseobacterium echinoideorum]|uniref:hypothetical protein n=1 Tax=Chryseobacterium echinoideorum TaxID=1549648 RepID=UPI001184CA20|nr:hypothetical protein [Chryseobacterium echinoideorum]
MKKNILTLFSLVWLSVYTNAQQSTLLVYNYSSYFLEARIEANGLNGNCYPRISSNDYSSYNLTFDPASGGTPFIAQFKKFNQGLSSTPPVSQWLVQSSATNPPLWRIPSHPVFVDTSVFTTSTDWTDCLMVARDASFNYGAELELGDPAYDSCNGVSETYQFRSTLEGEWFTLTSGSEKFTIVQVF